MEEKTPKFEDCQRKSQFEDEFCCLASPTARAMVFALIFCFFFVFWKDRNKPNAKKILNEKVVLLFFHCNQTHRYNYFNGDFTSTRRLLFLSDFSTAVARNRTAEKKLKKCQHYTRSKCQRQEANRREAIIICGIFLFISGFNKREWKETWKWERMSKMFKLIRWIFFLHKSRRNE